jgi:lipid A ethanolaminephosphotransferase
MKLPRLKLSTETLILIAAAFFLAAANNAFWHRLGIGLGAFSSAWVNYLVVAALLFSLLCLLLALITPRIAIKPVLTVLLVIAAGAAFFMDNYGAVIDRHALQSALESDSRESAEWLSSAMIWPALKIALIPSLLLWFGVELIKHPFAKAARRRVLFIVLCIGMTATLMAINFQPLASLARNHAVLRDLINPFNVINALRGHLKKSGRSLPTVMQPIAADVKRGPSWHSADAATRKPTLLVFVVGESARAASFGLLGYARDTTPELAKLPITLFAHTDSCGTNTATSVPCLFSNLGRANYDELQANSQDNLLDIYQRAGFDVEWVDNNTGSKNVARRVKEVDIAHRTDPEFCVKDGCHDEILVQELALRLPKITRDTVLVLHQLGSHGPAYFQRYPKAFARFTPICESVELQDCSAEALKNSYDNTILYTDFVLAQLIQKLQAADNLETAFFYVSDHGESTGESGFFLHGAPYSIAPDEQTQVPMLFWTSGAFAASRGLQAECLAQKRLLPSSHDAVFPMMLRFLDLQTQAYRAELDPIAACYAK